MYARHRYRRAVVMMRSLLCALVAVVSAACNAGPDVTMTMQPLVFPWEGQLGDSALFWSPPGNFAYGSTVALVIESNYNVRLDGLERHDLHTDRVDVWIYPLNGEFSPAWANVRSVFTLQSPPGAKRHLTSPGATMTTVLFDLPNEVVFPGQSITPPLTVEIRVAIDGVIALGGPQFSITGNQGSPNPIADETILGFSGFQDSLEPQRMIRLRGKRDPDPEGTPNPEPPATPDERFYEQEGSLASIEFDFTYPNTCLNGVRAFPSSEAATSTTLVGPVIAGPNDSSVHVLLVKPEGFDLKFHDYVIGFGDVTLAGTGPFIDLTFIDQSNLTCDISDPGIFTISNLIVTNTAGTTVSRVDGAVIVDSDESPDDVDAVLRWYAVDVSGV